MQSRAFHVQASIRSCCRNSSQSDVFQILTIAEGSGVVPDGNIGLFVQFQPRPVMVISDRSEGDDAQHSQVHLGNISRPAALEEAYVNERLAQTDLHALLRKDDLHRTAWECLWTAPRGGIG